MPKWEYMTVMLGLNGKGLTVPHQVNQQELPNWSKGPPIEVFLNQLGDQGWELFAVHGWLYLRRPKP